VVNLERGDMVQVTMPKPYIKYKIISSSRSRDICYKSVNGWTNGRTDGEGDCNIAPTQSGGIIIFTELNNKLLYTEE
jgi:hypothetical protein